MVAMPWRKMGMSMPLPPVPGQTWGQPWSLNMMMETALGGPQGRAVKHSPCMTACRLSMGPVGAGQAMPQPL